MSLDFARRVRGTRAPDLAIGVLFSSTLSITADGWRRTVSSEIGDTAYCVALNFDIRAKHLPDEWFQASERNDEKLVFGCERQQSVPGYGHIPLTARLPRAALAAR